MINQVAFSRLAGLQLLLQRVEHEVGAGRVGTLQPAILRAKTFVTNGA